MHDKPAVRLARDLYREHNRAIDFIMEHRENDREILTKLVEERMRRTARRLGLSPMATAGGYVRFLPSAWDTPANCRGDSWSQWGDSAYVLGEIDLWTEPPSLYIVTDGASKAWTERLWQLGRREKYPLMSERA